MPGAPLAGKIWLLFGGQEAGYMVLRIFASEAGCTAVGVLSKEERRIYHN
jgi:hypothetical protein